MRAARYYGAGDVRIEDVDEVPVSSRDVRIAVAFCGICGTDVHEYDSGPRFTPPSGHPHPVTHESVPITLGHEFSGEVVEIGSEVTRVVVGDKVVVEPSIVCGDGDFGAVGDDQLCENIGFTGLSGSQGGLAETCVVDERWVHPAGDLPLDVAALAEPLAVAHHAVSRAALGSTDSVLILGAGPVALLALACAREKTTGRICIVARSDLKADVARSLKADSILDPRRGDLAEAALQESEGRGFDVVLECAGSASLFELSLLVCRKGGRIVAASSDPEPASVDVNLILAKELTILGSLAYRGDFPGAISLLQRSPDRYAQLITDVVPLDGLQQALMAASSREREQIKVLVSLRTGQDG